jgi:RND family efflux transporter MFP subunit
VELKRLEIDRSGSAPAARRRRKNPWIGRGVVLAIVAALLWLFRVPLIERYERMALPTVDVVVVTPISASQTTALAGTSANGYVVASTRAALSADTPGRVVELNVVEGSVVKAGDVVARLFDEEYAAAVRASAAEVAASAAASERAALDAAAARSDIARASADVDAARARLAAAETDLDLFEKEVARAQELLANSVGSEQALDRARADVERGVANVATNGALAAASMSALEQVEARAAAAAAAQREAEARVPVAQARLEQAQATLSKTVVRAPFDGIVVLKDAEVGEVVSPNSQGGNSRGSVVTMVDFASLEVQVDLPETSLGRVFEGQSAAVFLDAFSDERLDGVVSRIWPTASRQKSTVEVRVRFATIDSRVKPDMGARVVFGAPERDAAAANEPQRDVGAIVLPESCFRGGGAERTVFVHEAGVVRERRVAVEPAASGRVRVTSGLAAGEQVVKEPPPRLADGDRVRLAKK